MFNPDSSYDYTSLPKFIKLSVLWNKVAMYFNCGDNMFLASVTVSIKPFTTSAH